MNTKICLFQDYLSAISIREKNQIFRDLRVEIIDSHPEESETKYRPLGAEFRNQYRNVIIELKDKFGKFGPNSLEAIAKAETDNLLVNEFSEKSRRFFNRLREQIEIFSSPIASWAINPINWFRITSKKSAYELQTEISSEFPCLIFDDIPLECFSTPDVSLANLDEILSLTGIFQAWQNDNFGKKGKIVVLDTGISPDLKNQFNINETTVGSLSPGDDDGHGTAICALILALVPKAEIESIKVMSSFDNGNIWNLINGLTSLYSRKFLVINTSLGLKSQFIGSLGPAAISLQEAISNIVSSSASQHSFLIGAAGNEARNQLSWPSAASEALSVGAHTGSLTLSSFSNYSTSANNFILTPGGDLRKSDLKTETFGKYGQGLSRNIYGTSFSCAIATSISALLQNYSWFQAMDIPSRISLFRNHCRKNIDGFPILNIADIGAVWPLRNGMPD